MDDVLIKLIVSEILVPFHESKLGLRYEREERTTL